MCPSLVITVHEARRLLGVPVGASKFELRAGFRRRVLATHPDRNPNDPHATRRLMRVIAAYELLRSGPPVPRAPTPAATPQPVVTPRGRYCCPRCHDSFELHGACVRCELPLWDSASGHDAPPVPAEPAVDRLIERLERRPIRQQPRIDPARAPFYASAGLVLGGLSIAALGPISAGLAITSYGFALAALAVFGGARLQSLQARFE